MHGVAVKERPILFSGEMVRAILEGRKTQTRRVITGLPEDFALAKPQFQTVGYDPASGLWKFSVATGGGIDREVNIKGFRASLKVREYDLRITDERACPYGNAGERLWVREGLFNPVDSDTWSRRYHYAADNTPSPLFSERDRAGSRPSIHMPRWASRITLEVVRVRVERLQQCSEEDALAEGFPPTPVIDSEIEECDPGTPERAIAEKMRGGQFTSKFNFGFAWDAINEKRGYSWASNPLVWVIDFKRVEA